jgi:hypothetical protein
LKKTELSCTSTISGTYQGYYDLSSSGSQEERISILNMALTHKGIYTGSGSHYALPANPPSHVEPAPTSAPIAPNRRSESSSFAQQNNGVDDNDIDDGGIFL